MKFIIKSLLFCLPTMIIATMIWTFLIPSAQSGNQNSVTNESKIETKMPSDPCQFISPFEKGVTLEEFQARDYLEMKGYPKEIPLTQAVEYFNKQKQCTQYFASYPLLTEDEIIAAIVAGGGYEIPNKEAWGARQKILWEIATRKVMPKGSLLVFSSGADIQQSPLRPNGIIKARGISIAILLGMENNEPNSEMKSEQIFEIRRTYFSIDVIK